MLNSHLVDVADLPATLPSLDEESQSVSTDDTASFVQACDAERFGTWAFCTLVRGVEWDPAVFTRIVGECEPKLKMTLESASIFTFACRSRVTPVPSGYVPVEGYLKMQGNNTVLRSTLKRRLQHPDLQNPEDPSRSWGVEWTACRVGRKGRYTDHDFIARFHRETALPPAGDGAGAAGGATAGAPAPAAPSLAAAWRAWRAAQPPRLRGASLGPR